MKPYAKTIRAELEATLTDQEHARTELLSLCALLGASDPPTTLADARYTLAAHAQFRTAVSEYLYAEDLTECSARLALVTFAFADDAADLAGDAGSSGRGPPS